jgi:hypothetical protein
MIENLKQVQAKWTGTQEVDESGLFGSQIAAALWRLSHHQQAVGKLRIQQVLLDVEFGGTAVQLHSVINKLIIGQRHLTGYFKSYQTVFRES